MPGFLHTMKRIARVGGGVLLCVVSAPRWAGAAASLKAPMAQSAAVVPEQDPAFDLEEFELEQEETPEVHDPLERANRVMYGLNRGLSRFLIDPLARIYGFSIPQPAKQSLRNFFGNLNEPVVIVNELLQLRIRQVTGSGARFLVNSTLGLGGLIDVARRVDLAHRHADFSQTLSRTGLGTGPYLVLPVIGPSNARDVVGSVVDGFLRPDTWLLSPGGRFVLATGGGISRKEAHLEELEELERSSLDPYVTIRGAYLMSRSAENRSDP